MIRHSDPETWRMRTESGDSKFYTPSDYSEILRGTDQLCILVASNDDRSIEIARVALSTYRANVSIERRSLRSADDAELIALALSTTTTGQASDRSLPFTDMGSYASAEEETAATEDAAMPEAAVESSDAAETVTAPDPSVVAA